MKQTCWRPVANSKMLRARAELLAKLRAFFAARDVLEVTTPLLAQATVTDLHIHSLQSAYHVDLPNRYRAQNYFLQTSPEYAMKRLLAANCGAIYQICKAFRDGESGRQHNPEFTLLEWYRPGFDHHDLISEVDLLLQEILGTEPAERITYQTLFEQHCDFDPHDVDIATISNCLRRFEITLSHEINSCEMGLDLLFSHVIEPSLGQTRPVVIYDYPVGQAALARIIATDTTPVAARFEVFYKGAELVNGFYELADLAEQRARFVADNELRRANDLPEIALDEHFLAALGHGLPDCAGVAVGVDRLLMLLTGAKSIDEVLAFPFARA